MDYEVVVVGAGAAGLMAGRELARAGRSIALVEARDRVGGRLHSVCDPFASAPVELGGEFVHGRPAVTYELLREYGAAVVDNAETSFVFRDGTLAAADSDPFADAAALLAPALSRAEDESVDALLERASRDAAAAGARSSTRRLVAGFDAADPARASARAIAQEWAGDASADGAQSRPIGGYAPLIAHLARSLDPQRVDVRLQTIVTQIARDERGVRIAATAGGRNITLQARAALVSVPHGVLRARPPAEGAIAFEPPLPLAMRAAIEHIEMGPVVKVVLCFRTAFWETLGGGAWRDGAFFNGDGVFPTIWTQLPVRANTLVAWAGGPAAAALSAQNDAALAEHALECVGRYFANAGAARAALVSAHMSNWQRDPFARGAYSYAAVGGEGAREALTAAVDDRLWFAGEATAAGGEGGTVAGALESGRRAAGAILKVLPVRGTLVV